MLPLPEYSQFGLSLLTAVGPVSAIPVFLTQTKGFSPEKRSRTAIVAAGTAAFVLVAAALTGHSLLPLLGASLGSLQVAGGLVMLLLALPQLSSQHMRVEARRGELPPEQGRAPGIVPIGFPLLAGPAAISSVIVGMRHGSGVAHAAIVISFVLAICGACWLVLRAAQSIEARVGQGALSVLNKLFALLLATIAVELISGGFRTLFPILR